MHLVLIHGLGQTALDWDKTIEGLDKQNQVVCPDLCEMLKDKEVNYNTLYCAFSEYCNAFSEPLNLCGLSLGGILALNYAIDYPAKVNSMVLIGTQYTMPKRLLAVQNMIFHFMPNSMFQKMGFGKQEFIGLSKSMMELDFNKDLRKVTCPVLVMCGEKDNANKKAAEGLVKYLPNAKLYKVAGAGHEVNVDRPEVLANILNDFYERI